MHVHEPGPILVHPHHGGPVPPDEGEGYTEVSEDHGALGVRPKEGESLPETLLAATAVVVQVEYVR